MQEVREEDDESEEDHTVREIQQVKNPENILKDNVYMMLADQS